MEYILDGATLPAAGTYKIGADALYGHEAKRVLAVRIGGETLPLTDTPRTGETAEGITYESEEGRRIYERSVRFVFLLAARRLFPGKRVRLEHSMGHGVYATIDAGHPLTAGKVAALEKEMRKIVEDDLPFDLRFLSRDDAIAYFQADGQTDKVELLKCRPYEHFQLYECGGMYEYFYGVMVPSTGYLPQFKLQFYLPGLVILLPRPDGQMPPFQDMPKLAATFAKTARWNRILRCANVADLNRMTRERTLRELIRVSEALHEKSVSAIADQFVDSGARVILIAGPSSSGKTTFAHRLSIALRVNGLEPVKLSLDDYYLNRDQIPRDENGEVDLERLDTLDVPLFNEHLVELLQGAEVETPTFDFKTGRRAEETHKMKIRPDQPILIEGIHGLNDSLTSEVARRMKFKIYISALTALNLDDHNRIRTTDARLLRRLVRDHLFRGTPPEETLAMWGSVRRGEEAYIFPYQEEADVMFNSSLVYELCILKKYIYPMLSAMKPEHPQYTLAKRLVKFLNYIQTSDVEDEIPPNSILREFIGGCCFYKNLD